MAFELAAGIVGITSLAVQLADSAQKLHGYCHDYSTAPKQVKDLAEEVETLRGLIEDLSAPQDANIGTAHVPSTPATLTHDERCRRWCLSIQENVASVLQELEQNFVKHSRRTKVKFIFKKERFEEWMEKLERAKSMLLLARQLDQGESVRRKLDALSQKSDLLAAGIAGVKQSVDAATTGIQNVGNNVAAVMTSTNVIEQDITTLTSESINSRVQQARDMDVVQNGLHNITTHMAQHSQDVSSILADARSTQQIVAELPQHHHKFQRRMSAHSADQRHANAQILAILQGLQQRSHSAMQCNNRIEDVTDSIHRDARDTESQVAQVATSFPGQCHTTVVNTVESTEIDFAISLFPPSMGFKRRSERRSATQTQASQALKTVGPKRSKKETVAFRIKLPAAFVQYQWGLYVERANSTWIPHITPYYVRDFDYTLIDILQGDPAEKLQMMIRSKKASLRDIDVHGRNLLWWAANAFNEGMMTFLHDQGLRLDVKALTTVSPITLGVGV
ncbi:hypothetical protein MBLNU230_g0420t1 [Neophaeotheca triangularis]